MNGTWGLQSWGRVRGKKVTLARYEFLGKERKYTHLGTGTIRSVTLKVTGATLWIEIVGPDPMEMEAEEINLGNNIQLVAYKKEVGLIYSEHVDAALSPPAQVCCN